MSSSLRSPSSKKVTTSYFPSGIKFFAPIMAAIGIYFLYYGYYGWAVFFVLLAIIILTTHYATEINLAKKSYSDYLYFLGLRLNAESGTFLQLEKIVITKGDYATRVSSRTQNRTMQFKDYTGTLIFFDDHTLDLLTDLDKKRLLTNLKAFAEFLKVGVEDRTTHHPYWIDMDKY